MKKIITALAILTIVMACNDPKDPPKDWIVKAAQVQKAKEDSLQKIAALKEVPKQ